MASVFIPGDLVISVYGDGDGSGTYTDNQASPIVLEQINPTTGAIDPITGTVANGTLVNGKLVLPQSSVGTDNAISGEYGSSSEGSLQLSGDGRSLTIVGYGVNAASYNGAEASGNPYGNAALAQTTSVPGGASTPVARVVADIDANGTVDTSTALFKVFNTNNPRGVATTDGTSFYLGGQGVKGDTTQGVFYAQDGASSATAINTGTDARTVEISNGILYVSQDSKQPSTGGTSNISTFATAEPTGASAETPLPGISQTVSVANGKGNAINGSTGTVNLSPENFFFANSTTLYVADAGNPKQGGLGDGGLQKWSYNGTAWALDYTLSAGLGLVADTAKTGTTGLIGLTGAVDGNTVQLYATNSTLTDTGQTYLYGISDALNATSLPSTEAFTTLVTAAADTNIRGVAFAPQAATSPAPTTTTTPTTSTTTPTTTTPTTTTPSPASTTPTTTTAPTPAAAPTIAGTHTTTDTAEAAVKPFAGVTVADGNSTGGATEALTITLTGTGGALGEGTGYTGGNGTLTQTAPGQDGTYTLTGTAAAVTAELDALSFTPANGTAGGTVSTTFALTDRSTAGTAAGPDTGTVVTDTAAPPTTDTVSISPSVTYRDGVFTLSGTASSAAGVRSVEISAAVNGTRQDLGAATVKADGTFAFQDTIGANVQGFLRATETDTAGGTATSADPLFSLTGGLGPDYGAGRQTRYTADGEAATADTRFTPDGLQSATVTGQGQTFASAYDDTFDNAKQARTTFVFDPGFSLDVVGGFRVGGNGHDTLSFKGSDFGTTPQAQLGALLANSYESQGSFFIVDPTTQDAVQLKGITTGQFARNERDVVFHA